MAKQSAGLMMFRQGRGVLEILLAHPGGPYWQTRNDGAWTIPKGGIHAGETALESAMREFREETGFESAGPYLPLGHVTQRGGKVVHAWAFEGDCDPSRLVSMETTIEWPPNSGIQIPVPEVDRVEFFTIDRAAAALNPAQAEFIGRLIETLAGRDGRR